MDMIDDHGNAMPAELIKQDSTKLRMQGVLTKPSNPSGVLLIQRC